MWDSLSHVNSFSLSGWKWAAHPTSTILVLVHLVSSWLHRWVSLYYILSNPMRDAVSLLDARRLMASTSTYRTCFILYPIVAWACMSYNYNSMYPMGTSVSWSSVHDSASVIINPSIYITLSIQTAPYTTEHGEVKYKPMNWDECSQLKCVENKIGQTTWEVTQLKCVDVNYPWTKNKIFQPKCVENMLSWRATEAQSPNTALEANGIQLKCAVWCINKDSRAGVKENRIYIDWSVSVTDKPQYNHVEMTLRSGSDIKPIAYKIITRMTFVSHHFHLWDAPGSSAWRSTKLQA